LVSAILVAAIPVENLQAEGEDAPKVTVDIQNCQIPVIDESETIYTTGDGQYQFAYVSPNNASSNNKVAVILGYNGGYLENGNLTLPDKLDAYLKYSDNLGTSSGYSAVGKSGNFLFYSVDEIQYDSTGQPITEMVPVKDAEGNYMKDENGNPIYEEKIKTKTVYYPCYYEDRAKWEHLEVDEFYYHPDNTVSDNSAGFLPTTQSQYQRIQGAEVWYIGNQYLEAGTGANSGTWKIPSGGGFITA
ncbi:MAG: hypothetical protein IJD31_06430, partial [Lachnospiraceae bacterium]|nr:hypothetical protein [Lachnospiraceae bacterium]